MSINIETVFFTIVCLSFGANIITAIQSEIENYPGVTTDDCGKGHIPDMADDRYFEWNKFDDPRSSFLNGRPALPNEVPFVVPILSFNTDRNYITKNSTRQLKGECIGTILNAHWVITSEGCLLYPERIKDTYEYLIYPGIKDFKEVHNLTTAYSTTRHFQINLRDKYSGNIALLKYEKPIILAKTSAVNSVCLPKNKSVNFNDEFALITGLGSIAIGNKKYPELIGWAARRSTDIYVGWAKFDDQWYYPHILEGYQPIPFGEEQGCVGSMGSPLVQYVNKRAVLIGLHLNSDLFIKCSMRNRDPKIKNDKGIDWYLKISNVTDKIINIIKSN